MIPVSEPLLGDREIEYVTDCLRSGWISSEGRYIGLFEAKVAQLCHRSHGVAVNNGTAALELALRALELPPGSEVILPTFTIISCALACLYNDLVPVFTDVDPDTWTLSATELARKISPRTRAVMPVHIYGHPVDMAPILQIAKQHDLRVIEDFAEAIGSEYQGQPCGGFGDISCTSFYANKLITTGEGGMCLTDDERLAGKMRSLKNLAFLPEKRFVHRELGFNFRLTNVQAAIGLAQAERMSSQLAKKRAMAARYLARLAGLQKSGLIVLPVEREWARNSYWMFGILLTEKAGKDAETVMNQLREKGVQTRPFFFPMHRQPVFQSYPWYREESLPVAERISAFGFYLPSGLTLREDQIDEVVDRVTEVLA